MGESAASRWFPSRSSERLTRFGPRFVRRATSVVVAAMLSPGSSWAEATPRILEVPAAVCDVCTPGRPPPPPEVRERVRRINQSTNWRRQADSGDTIPLGTATRIWLQRAWASGRLQPGVAQTRAPIASAGLPGFRTLNRAQQRTSLGARSRSRLADRRSTRDQGSATRSRRGNETSGLGPNSLRGSNRSSSSFSTAGPGNPSGFGMQ